MASRYKLPAIYSDSYQIYISKFTLTAPSFSAFLSQGVIVTNTERELKPLQM
jgi:hypothetical protein